MIQIKRTLQNCHQQAKILTLTFYDHVTLTFDPSLKVMTRSSVPPSWWVGDVTCCYRSIAVNSSNRHTALTSDKFPTWLCCTDVDVLWPCDLDLWPVGSKNIATAGMANIGFTLSLVAHRCGHECNLPWLISK